MCFEVRGRCSGSCPKPNSIRPIYRPPGGSTVHGILFCPEHFEELIRKRYDPKLHCNDPAYIDKYTRTDEGGMFPHLPMWGNENLCRGCIDGRMGWPGGTANERTDSEGLLKALREPPYRPEFSVGERLFTWQVLAQEAKRFGFKAQAEEFIDEMRKIFASREWQRTVVRRNDGSNKVRCWIDEDEAKRRWPDLSFDESYI